MEVNKVIQGDCLEVMKSLPDKCIGCIITSPPYWQLRDYGWSGQWGLEPTFQMYLDNLISFIAEAKRVLKDDGTIWVNLGDTYGGGTSGTGGGYKEDSLISNEIKGIHFSKNTQKPSPKCLLLIPHRFAIRCIDELGLILRNDIIWAKPNAMPESVTDRFSKKHEYFFLFAKNEKYYFDLDSIRDKHLIKTEQIRDKNKEGCNNAGLNGNHFSDGVRSYLHTLGKNPGDVSDFWNIPTKPNLAKHYATYNTKLIDKPIIAGCPENGIILDPFCGTGTTLVRSIQLNRQAIGIEGNTQYARMAQENLNNELDKFKLAI